MARALYESEGFINREDGPDGPIMYVYERDLSRPSLAAGCLPPVTDCPVVLTTLTAGSSRPWSRPAHGRAGWIPARGADRAPLPQQIPQLIELDLQRAQFGLFVAGQPAPLGVLAQLVLAGDQALDPVLHPLIRVIRCHVDKDTVRTMAALQPRCAAGPGPSRPDPVGPARGGGCHPGWGGPDRRAS